MKELVFRDKSLVAVIRSLVQYSKTFELSYDVSVDKAHICDACKVLMSCGSQQGAVEATYRRYVRQTRLMRRYHQSLVLFRNVNSNGAASDRAVGGGGLGIWQLENSLLLESYEQSTPLFVEAAAVFTSDSTKGKELLRCSTFVPAIPVPQFLQSG